MYRFLRGAMTVLSVALATVGVAAAAQYPPEHVEIPDHEGILPNSGTALLFTNTHIYGPVTILVEVFDNCGGNFSFYEWRYTVTNNGYDPRPGLTNGFSGFELALPTAVPDIHSIAPNVGQLWNVNCCSGLPVEWDKPNANGLGVMPSGVGVFSFCTLPRLIVPSTGWYHTWEGFQTDLVYYPPGDELEVPDVLAPPVSVESDSWGRIKGDYR